MVLGGWVWGGGGGGGGGVFFFFFFLSGKVWGGVFFFFFFPFVVGEGELCAALETCCYKSFRFTVQAVRYVRLYEINRRFYVGYTNVIFLGEVNKWNIIEYPRILNDIPFIGSRISHFEAKSECPPHSRQRNTRSE